ncbi:hypothetical protein [Stigmatella aurantiaca]|uniref:hypothetical protein n=1 Tax=Stigmatella aurantiaca TaxID=41 RepID=UPI00116015B6|nr:hypothetical protein [Stigmatella aurantiaca]
MSQEQAKKAREQGHLERFLSLQGIRPKSTRPGDPLDFVLDLGGRLVGVELVDVDDQAQRKNNAMANQYIVREIEKALREKKYVLHLQLIWKAGLTRFARGKGRVGVFLDKLMAVIDDVAPSLGDDAFVLKNDEKDQRLRNCDLAELSTLVLEKVNYLTESKVDSIPVALGQGAPPIQAILRKKEAKLPEYRRILEAGEIWLLIVTGTRFEQNVVVSLVKERNMQSQFDRVFLLDYRTGTVVSLKCGPEKQ